MTPKTLSYSLADAWPSFYSFIPEWMIGMNNYFYSFKGGNLYQHNTNELRNNFYGVQYTSKIKTVLNDAPLENKLFKTLNLEGDAAWDATAITDIENTGFSDKEWFEEKEASFYAYIRNQGTVPAQSGQFALRSANGIGRSATITGTGNNVQVNFAVLPTPVVIGSMISVGDMLYYSLPPTYNTPVLFGQVKSVQVNYPNAVNRITVDTTITGGSIPGIQTPYIMFVKNSVAESQGVLGHYCVVELENDSADKVELFSLESEVMKSYP